MGVCPFLGRRNIDLSVPRGELFGLFALWHGLSAFSEGFIVFHGDDHPWFQQDTRDQALEGTFRLLQRSGAALGQLWTDFLVDDAPDVVLGDEHDFLRFPGDVAELAAPTA